MMIIMNGTNGNLPFNLVTIGGNWTQMTSCTGSTAIVFHLLLVLLLL